MSAYRAKLERDTARANAATAVGRDIGLGWPKAARGAAKRRAACERDLKLFLEQFFPAAFPLPWSVDHPRVIASLQGAILGGGYYALAMPRGSGKTGIAVRAAIWAVVYGHCRYVVLLGATQDDAGRLLRTVKTELMSNELLARDFRAVTYPVRCLEDNARRCIGQLFRGERTGIVWSAKRVILPTMPDDAFDGGPNVSGSVIAVGSLEGAVRGHFHTLASGEVIRPDLALLDDVQTRESSASVEQTNRRLETIRGDVLALAGPGKKITAVGLLTVIQEGDLADQLLDRQRNPQWHGEKTAALYSWPEAETLWQEYHAIRAECMRGEEPTTAATEFYRQRQPEMDQGARVAWPERKYEDELSGLQHLENLRHDLGDAAFSAEYLNDPLRSTVEADILLTADDVAGKVSGLPRGVLPMNATIITVMIDIHDALLFWCVCAWSTDFTGHVCDYGTFPPQRKRIFTLRKAEPTLQDIFPTAGREGAILAGLNALTGELLAKDWRREDNALLRVGRCLVDSGYVPDVVYQFCSNNPHAAVLMPSRGVGIGAKQTPFAEFTPKQGEKHGWNWLTSKLAHRQGLFVKFDANAYKSFVHSRLVLTVGDRGGLTLFGHDPEEHRLFSQHVVAESAKLVTLQSTGRTVAEWEPKPGAGDNHWLDTLAAAAVGAAMQGAAPEGKAPQPLKPPPSGRKPTLRELQARARGMR